MKTYFLGTEEVRAYLRDLIGRLDPMPTVWCPVTESGARLVAELTRLVAERRPDLLTTVEVEPIVVGDRSVTLAGQSSLKDRSVLLLDGAVHSGRMMSACVDEVLKCGPSAITTYSLMVKRRSVFIPTLWGAMTDDADRMYFQLDEIPNNRLDAGRTPQAAVHLRKLDQRVRNPIVSGVPSIDRATWGDRFFQMQANPGTCTYVLESAAEDLGFLTVHHDGDTFSVAEVVIAPTSRGKGYAGILVRFADTLARQSDCKRVCLNAIKNRVPMYEGFGYRRSDRSPILLEQEEYQPMEKAVLYHHLDPTHAMEAGGGSPDDASVQQTNGS